jgi:hypothetical protein
MSDIQVAAHSRCSDRRILLPPPLLPLLLPLLCCCRCGWWRAPSRPGYVAAASTHAAHSRGGVINKTKAHRKGATAIALFEFCGE